MSRHRLVRNLNIQDELDDDDISEEDPFEGITPDQQAELDAATDQVFTVLTDDSLLTDTEIRRSLWDNYFDVQDTLGWALDEQKKRKATKDKKEPDEPPEPSASLSPLAKLAAARNGNPSLKNLAASRTSLVSPVIPGATKPSLASLAAARSTIPVALPRPNQQASSNASTPLSSTTVTTGQSKLALLAKSRSIARQPIAISTASAQANTNPSTKPLSKLALKLQEARKASAPPPHPASPSLVTQDVALHRGNGEDPEIVTSKDEDLDPLFSCEKSITTSMHPEMLLVAPPSIFASLLLPRPSNTQEEIRNSHEKVFSVSTGFAFDTPSPDDLVVSKREGTKMLIPATMRSERAEKPPASRKKMK